MWLLFPLNIHHHTGGLEIKRLRKKFRSIIHHHTGGLENSDKKKYE
ncbi:hypothetical protein BAZOLSSOX_233 [uncultured Gammaproteobacteria bacterium]|nr:hypothetical protein BAZOLSSOX_233 [uncultured Gammaproteobacteria bacterium]